MSDEIKIKKSSLAIIIVSAVVIVGVLVSLLLILPGAMKKTPEETTETAGQRTTVTDLTEKDTSGNTSKNDPYKGKSKADKKGHMLPVQSKAQITLKTTASDHKCNYKKDKVLKASCTSEGYTLYKCSCGKQYVADYSKVMDHDYTKATCKEPATCRMCGKTTGGLGDHNWGKWTSMGRLGHQKVCSLCGKLGDEEPHSLTLPDPTYCYAEKCSKCGWSDYQYVSSDYDGGWYYHEFIGGECYWCGYRR